MKTFNNPEFGDIRTVLIDGAIWFVGKDAAIALGYSNPRKAIYDHVDEDDKGVTKWNTPGGVQDLVIINESGLYSLILSSKLPGAKRFKRWVTAEILPSVREHGAYMTDDTINRMIASPEFGIKLLTELKAEQDKRKALEEKVKADAPAVFFAEAVTGADSNILVREMAKLLSQNGYDIGGNRLYEQLRQEGYLIKNKGTDYNMPTQKAMELGLFFVRETPRVGKNGTVLDKVVRVTPRGQKYFINKYAPKKALLEN